LLALPSLIPHDSPPQQVVQGPLRAGMDFGAVDTPATFSILNPLVCAAAHRWSSGCMEADIEYEEEQGN
jgi:hypothetical protein